jgi:hypothetical protein
MGVERNGSWQKDAHLQANIHSTAVLDKFWVNNEKAFDRVLNGHVGHGWETAITRATRATIIDATPSVDSPDSTLKLVCPLQLRPVDPCWCPLPRLKDSL